MKWNANMKKKRSNERKSFRNDNRKQIGAYGEALALRKYLAAGYDLIEKNYRCRFGEIDLIVSKDNLLIFVEVRTKTTERYGYGEESITVKKKLTIKQVSQHYLLNTQLMSKQELNVQYDVVAVYINIEKKLAWIKRFPQAF